MPRVDARARQIADEIVGDYYGEGPIAFPELIETLLQRVTLESASAVEVVQSALISRYRAGTISIRLGPALADELGFADGSVALKALADDRFYRYGDGEEVRAWFQIPAGSPD
jgi:hypothetical protein